MIHRGYIFYSHSYCPVPIEKSKLAGEFSEMESLNRKQFTLDRLTLEFKEPGYGPREDSIQYIAPSRVSSAHFDTQVMAIEWNTTGETNLGVPQSSTTFDQDAMLVGDFNRGFFLFLQASFCAAEASFAWRYLPEIKKRSLQDMSAWWSTS